MALMNKAVPLPKRVGNIFVTIFRKFQHTPNALSVLLPSFLPQTHDINHFLSFNSSLATRFKLCIVNEIS